MTITLKKVLFVGIGILCALFFFLVAVMPVSRTIGSLTLTGSLMGVLTGNEEAVQMVELQINVSDYVKNINPLTDPSAYAQALKAIKDAQELLVSVYKFFAVFAIVIFVICLLALIGGFFMKTIKGTRKLGIPFLAISIVLSLVVMIFAILMTVSTDMAKAAAGVNVSVSVGGPIIMYLLGILMFIAMLVASGVVKDVVLVGKKEEAK